MSNEIDRVITGHLLLLQEIGRVALALGEDGHKDVGTRDFLTPRGLDVDHRALDHTLETGCRLGVIAICRGQGCQIIVDVKGEFSLQRLQIDVAGLHDSGSFRIVNKCQKQMLQRGILVATLVRVADRAVQCLFERTRK